MTSERNNAIDIARTIAMVSIILGHLGVPSFAKIVFTYHVTMFYLIAGYFAKPSNNFQKFLYHKLRTLIIPYYISCAAVFPFMLLRSITRYAAGSPKDIIHYWSTAILLGSGWTPEYLHINVIGMVWFLWALFWAALILYGLLKCKPYVRLVSVFAYFAFMLISKKYFFLPFSLQPSGAALLFMYLGYLYHQIEPEVNKFTKEQKYTIYVLMVWLWLSFVKNFQSFWLVSDDVGRGIPDILGSLAGCSTVIVLCTFLNKKHNRFALFFGYFGKYSIMMVFFHYFEDCTGILRFIARGIVHSTVSNAFYTLKFVFELIFVFTGTYIFSKIPFLRKMFGLR